MLREMLFATAVLLHGCSESSLNGADLVDASTTDSDSDSFDSDSDANADLALSTQSPDLSTKPDLLNAYKIDLTDVFNAKWIYRDGVSFAVGGGLGSAGLAFSAENLAAVGFGYLVSDNLDVVRAIGQRIRLPHVQARTLHVLATTANGPVSYNAAVTYDDASVVIFLQTSSYWLSPRGFVHESIAAKMQHYNRHDGKRPTSKCY